MMNIDAIRTILLALRSTSGAEPLAGIEGLEMTAFMQHAALLSDAGFVDGRTLAAGDRTRFCLRGLTSSGADFADAILADEVWASVQEQARHAGPPTVAALHVWARAEHFRRSATAG